MLAITPQRSARNCNASVHRVERKLLKAVQEFYVDSRVCVEVGMNVCKWFPINVGLRHRSVMYPWLFNVYIDDVL